MSSTAKMAHFYGETLCFVMVINLIFTQLYDL